MPFTLCNKLMKQPNLKYNHSNMKQTKYSPDLAKKNEFKELATE